MKRFLSSSAALLALAGASSAAAGDNVGSSSQNLWGTNYSTTTWFVGEDSDSLGDDFYQPEGMTFYDGTLYLTGDADEADPAIISFVPGAGGSFSTPTLWPTATISTGDRWGAEGITVNPSGAGYGAFGGGVPTLASVESGTESDQLERVAGTIELGGGVPAPLTNIHQPADTFDPDDVAYVGSRNQFAVINDPSRIDFYDHDATTLIPTGQFLFPFAGVDVGDAKGLTVISDDFAEMLTGEGVAGTEAFLVAYETNDLAIFEFDGTQIGDTMAFTGEVLPPQAPEGPEIESIAVDELNQLIFVGDEAGSAITVIFVPEPTSLGLVLACALLAVRRR